MGRLLLLVKAYPHGAQARPLRIGQSVLPLGARTPLIGDSVSVEEDLIHMFPGGLDLLGIADSEPAPYLLREQMYQGRELYIAAAQPHVGIPYIAPRVVVRRILRQDSGSGCIQYESVEEFDGPFDILPAISLADGLGKIGEGGLGECRLDMSVGYRGEAPTFLERAVEVLLVCLAEDTQHGQREVHVLVVVKTYPRRPESAVLAVVGNAEPVAEFLGGEAVVEHGAYMVTDLVPFLHIQLDHLAMVGVAQRDALAAEIDAHMRLVPVIFHQELVARQARRMVEWLDLIHEVMALGLALQRAVEARRHVIAVDYTVDQT